MQKLISGFYTALITPFLDDGSLDEDGLRILLEKQVAGGADGVVILGTTGEAPTISAAEQQRIIAIAREEIPSPMRLVVGTGTYSTKKTLENTLEAQRAGADAAIIVTPYYNRPTQEGLYLHFKSVAEACSLPFIIYNIAGRTGQNMHTETLRRLMLFPNIVGVKEASGNIGQISDVIETARTQRPDFSVMSGDDALTLPIMALGGHGIISVIGNIVPEDVRALVDAAAQGDFATAQRLHYTLMPLVRMAFLETNPIPIKAAMRLLDMPSGHCRLPLCDLAPDNAEKLKLLLMLTTGSPQAFVTAKIPVLSPKCL